ncbi:MAB_1171c family putative transporter [Streptomyces scabiei]|uniref:MAB_1171c family putative transporter n=1 Tax=Streptomyces scabiei TaxID=1930 RepID=UPI0033C92C4C
MSPDFHIPYFAPLALLGIALAFKLPTFFRAWRNPDVRATTLLLTWAVAVIVVITPVNIDRLNVLTGVPNIAAPWAYTFLTAFCATGLTMIMRWREPPSEGRRRRMLAIYWVYATICAALWVTFILADVPEPRIYDLDTYYATTPWMREHTLLYLLAHMVSCLVAVAMLWKWFPEVTNRWIKSGVVCLQLGFLCGLAFGVAKLTAVGARWSGNDLDFLSTQTAPPFALLQGIFVGLGFIAPQAGPALQKWGRDQRDYQRLRSLWRTVRVTKPTAATARYGVFTSLELRLMQRQQRIRDALRLLAPYFDERVYRQALAVALTQHDEAKAHSLAGAIAVQHATDAYRAERALDTGGQIPQISTDITENLGPVAAALSQPRHLDNVRQHMASAESRTSHA